MTHSKKDILGEGKKRVQKGVKKAKNNAQDKLKVEHSVEQNRDNSE